MNHFNNRHSIGLIVGLALFFIMLLLPTPEGMNPKALYAGAVAVLMATFWITEAIPIAATAFIPVALFPLLGILDGKSLAQSYGHDVVLLILGGFFLSKAIEHNNLHKRIALLSIKLIGSSRSRIILSFMVATSMLSMWISNNATTLLMLPIGIAIIRRSERDSPEANDNFPIALMLSIAYSASIGGVGSLVGTPPNLVFVGMIRELYPDAPQISFAEWFKVGLPVVVLFIPVCWLYLVKFFKIKGSFAGGAQVIEEEYNALGPMSVAEKRVLAIFLLTAFGWIFRRDFDFGSFTIPGWSTLLGVADYVGDSTVAIFSSLLFFIIPSGRPPENSPLDNRLLTWKVAGTIPWGIAMIIGGGFAIANAVRVTGLSQAIGERFAFIGAFPTWSVLLIVVLFMVFLTEINSNTATTTIFLPVLATIAIASGAHPYLLMIPATVAASCAFMLPSGTGPNATILGSGYVTIPQMAKTGFYLNFIAVALITAIMYLIVVPMFGLSGGIPSWAH